MSLATTGGGGGGLAGAGGGGIAMAHHANAVGRVAAQPPPQAHASSGPAPPPSAAILGADLLDKNQLSLRQVKNVSHLPIVAIDLHGRDSSIAYFPKKPKDPSKGAKPVAVGKNNASDIVLQSGEASHKTLRKFLAKSRGYLALKDEVLVDDKKTNHKSSSVVLSKPHCWLGLRRVADAPEFLRNNSSLIIEQADESAVAIAEETNTKVGTTIANSTLDGSPSKHDDYDRVVFKVRLCESKKAISMLPEEAVEIAVEAARYMVASKVEEEHSDEDIADYPVAVALPAYAFADCAVDALSDALGSGSIILQRNVAALAGALLPSANGSLTKLLGRLKTVQDSIQKQYQQQLLQDPAAILQDDIMVIVIGVTDEGIETTSIQISEAGSMENPSCLFGNFRVISNVSHQDADPLSRLQQCGQELEAAIDTIAPDADGPAAVVVCGTAAEQKALSDKWNKVKNTEWKDVPVFASSVDAIAKGCSVLAAVSHGRLSRITKPSGAAKPIAELGIKVQNVAPVAVAVRMNYFGGQKGKWSGMKTVFDFDRQIPAGPYAFDFKASETVAYREKGEGLSEEDFLKEVKQYEGAKGIPLREEAALNFKVQVMQKWTRDGEWKAVGDVMEPLVKENETKDGKTKREACEEVRLELTLGVTGMITSSLIGERASVAIANKAARNSAIRYWVGIIFAVSFVGYFLFKSYYDDYVLKRDTKRLLAYYKHILPGSIHDGDEHSAMYTCYKYRNKKEKLWRNLEKKYGEPVLNMEDYEAIFAGMQDGGSTSSAKPEEETVDLDDDEAKDGTTNEEPDL